MNIDINNYEAFLLDFIEGKLSHRVIERLKLFIAQHPELGSWDSLTRGLPTLQDNPISFPHKVSLRKEVVIPFKIINETNYQEYFVGFYEGLLNVSEKEHLTNFLKHNPHLKQEMNWFSMAYLTPNLSEVCENREKLKKKVYLFSATVWQSIAIAASLLFFIGVAKWWQTLPTKAPIVSNELMTNSVAEAPSIIGLPQVVNEVTTNIGTKNKASLKITAGKQVQNYNSTNKNHILPQLRLVEAKAISGSYTSTNVAMPIPKVEQLSVLAEQQETIENPEKKSAIERILVLTFQNALAAVLPKKELPAAVQQVINYNVWDLASAGIKFYNTMADRDIQFIHEIDSNGNVSSVALVSEKINFSKSFLAHTNQ